MLIGIPLLNNFLLFVTKSVLDYMFFLYYYFGIIVLSEKHT